MPNAPETRRMPLDSDVVGWVQNAELGGLAMENGLVSPAITGITACQTMSSQDPHLSQPGHRFGPDLRNVVLRVFSFLRRRGIIQDDVDLAHLETRKFDIEVELDQAL